MTQELTVMDPRSRVLPRYCFDHQPDSAELRAATVRCMHDMLSVEWRSPEAFDYYKKGAVAGKHFQFEKDQTYLGLPYTDAQVTLYGFWEYFDPETGLIRPDLIREAAPAETEGRFGQACNALLGNTCTGSTGWAYAATCASVRGGMISFTLVPKNGFFPVGDYSFDLSVNDLYRDITTPEILAANGEARMMEAYACIQPADLVTQNGSNPAAGHSMMALGSAVTVRDGRGLIDPEKSYVPIQDQKAGFFPQVNGRGELCQSSGRLLWHASFRFLFDSGYMPVTAKELTGEKPWEVPAATLAEGVLRCNYAAAVLKYLLPVPGGELRLAHYELSRTDIRNERAYAFPVAELLAQASARQEALGLTGKPVLSVTLANGAEFRFA